MKHIKKFNETVSFKDELTEFTKNGLAYIMDNGIDVSVMNGFGDVYKILIRTPNRNTKLDSLKDDLIPFITILNDKYFITSLNIIYELRETGIITPFAQEESIEFEKDYVKEIEEFNTNYLKRIWIVLNK